MATVKKGILTAAGEWWKHLRPWGKRDFWGRERAAARHELMLMSADWEAERRECSYDYDHIDWWDVIYDETYWPEMDEWS
jgi:hypothetical protein